MIQLSTKIEYFVASETPGYSKAFTEICRQRFELSY